MKEMISVKNVKKTFIKSKGETFDAVRGITFNVYEGDIFSFLGPNGAGKSTSINMMTTQLSITSGTIFIDGMNIVENPIETRKKIGIVAQHNNLDRGLTALENLIYHGQYFGMSKNSAKNRALELLKDFGLLSWKDDYVKTFSGGMSQRLKIARAIMHKPKILFLDEPTTGLDPNYREILWQHVLDLNKKNNTTVFLTTHYMEEPERFSNRIAIYNQGEIKKIGTLEALKNDVKLPITLDLRLSQISEQLLEDFKQTDFVSKIIQKDDDNLKLYLTTSKDILPRVLEILSTHDILVEDMIMKQPTLEDIFIALTSEEGEVEK